MTTQAVAAAVEGVARAMHDLAVALAATDPSRPDRPAPAVMPTGNGRRCDCGGAVVWREWTSKAGKDCRAWKCENARAGEQHFIEWAS